MLDSGVRSRRRHPEEPDSFTTQYDDHDSKKYTNVLPASFNPIQSVLNASTTQLWGSAQEAFSSFQSSYSKASSTVSCVPQELEAFPELSIFGDIIDKLEFAMPSRDRTSEFRTFAKSYQMKVQGNGFRTPERHEILAESVQFNQLAKRIGRDLSQTCAKMEKIAEIARKKSLFDDRTEMERMSKIVKEDITSLNKQIAALQDFSRRRVGSTKTQGGNHSHQVVVGLQSKLASVSKDYQTVLELNTTNMKHQRSRREMFSNAEPVPYSIPSSSSAPNVRARLLAQDEDQYRGESVALDMGAVQNIQSQQTALRDTSHDYIQSRSNAMETIEGSISELGQIFTQLASLVSEQGDMITRIDSNVEETSLNIDAAHTELMRLPLSRVFLLIVIAFLLVLINAYVTHRQFYPAVVYITKSSPSMAVVYSLAIVLVYLLFILMRKIFFGELRAAEADHLSDRTWHAVLDTCLIFTVFRDDFSPVFVARFAILLFLKCFHWIADDRVDLMERSPVITWKFHARMLGVISMLGALDSYLMSEAYFSIVVRGHSYQIVFGFEYAILFAQLIHITVKYILHMHDLRTAHPWENKAVYLLYTELVISLIRCVFYGVFALLMVRLHTLPLFAIRPIYLSLRALHKAFTDVILSRRAINAMNTLFPVVSNDELNSMDATCIICREEMTAEAQPKRLPCSHVFHAHCLRTWFQRQQTCPTCRTDILSPGRARPTPGAAQAPAQPAQVAPVNAQNPRPQVRPVGIHVHHVHQFPQHLGAENPGAQFVHRVNGARFQAPPMIPFMLPGQIPPNFMGAPPHPQPFPQAPVRMGLGDDEVSALLAEEAETVAAIQHRLATLKNIQVLLDAAEAQFSDYMAITRHRMHPTASQNSGQSGNNGSNVTALSDSSGSTVLGSSRPAHTGGVILGSRQGQVPDETTVPRSESEEDIAISGRNQVTTSTPTDSDERNASTDHSDDFECFENSEWSETASSSSKNVSNFAEPSTSNITSNTPSTSVSTTQSTSVHDKKDD